MDLEVNLWLKYPLIKKYVEGAFSVYRGSISVNDEDYNISVTETEDKVFSFSLPEKLSLYESDIRFAVDRLEHRSIVAVLDTIIEIVRCKVASFVPENHCDIYKHVLWEYSELTKFYLNLKLCCLAQDLSEINVSLLDERNREHHVKISVNFADLERAFKITATDLPQSKEPFKESKSLKAVYEQFSQSVEALQPFFDLMDVFDKNCWILDPLEAKRNCAYRRICLGKNVSVVVTVDPYNVCGVPEMRFLGPERSVEVYRQRLNDNLENWFYGGDVFLEVLKLLGMDSFPLKPVSDDKLPDMLKENGDCSICFSLRLNDHLPEVVCKNKFCENYYHAECLYEWLISVNARRFFSEVVGQCPNCEKNISCPIPQ